jgi:hypothetical protein
MRRTFLTTTAWVMALLALGACGGGGGGAGEVASLSGSGATTTTPDDRSDKDVDPQDAMLEFAKCMRSHGIDMPDPEVAGSGRPGIMIRRDGGEGAVKFDDERFKAAEEDCEHFLREARGSFEPPSPEEQAEMRDQMLAFAKCMREHGIEMPDPTFDGEGRVSIQAGAAQGEVDFESGEFQAAQEACSEIFGGEGGFIARAGGGR